MFENNRYLSAYQGWGQEWGDRCHAEEDYLRMPIEITIFNAKGLDQTIIPHGQKGLYIICIATNFERFVNMHLLG